MNELPSDEVLDRLSDAFEEARRTGRDLDPHALARRLGIAPDVVLSFQSGGAAFDPVPPVLRALSQEGRYVYRGLISQGGMGAVYRASDTRLERDVAIKVLLACVFNKPARRERFLREARAAAQLRHPNALAIYDLGQVGDDVYLVLEFVEGARTLEQALSDLGWRERVSAIRDAARAVGRAHHRGLIHRDLKPDNVLVDRLGQVRVIDFGLSRPVDAPALTASGAIVGTFGYLSPEQARGDRDNQGPATDVWSLGVLLYEALASVRPFPGTSQEFLAALHQRLAPTPLRALVPELSPRLEAICARALAHDPGERYGHADAFADALDSVLDESAPSTAGVSRGQLLVACALSLITGALAASLALAPLRSGASSSPRPAVSALAPSPASSPLPALAALSSAALVSVEHVKTRAPVGVAFSPVGRLVSYGLVGLKEWTRDGRRFKDWSPGQVVSALPVRGGDWVFVTARQVVRRTLFRARTAESTLWTIPSPGVSHLAASPSGAKLAFVTRSGGVHVLASRVGEPHLLCEVRSVLGLTFVDEALLVIHAKSADGSRLELWNTIRKVRLAALERRRLSSLAVSPEGRLIALGHASGRLTLHGPDLAQLQVLSDPRVGRERAFAGALGPLAFTPEGPEGSRLYASPGPTVPASDRRIKRFEVPSGALRALTPPLRHSPSALALEPRRGVLAVGFVSGRAELWSLPER